MARHGTVLGRGALAAPKRSFRPSARTLALMLLVGAGAANIFAASISFSSSSTLGTGAAIVAACDTDGFSVKPVTSWVATDTAFRLVSVIVGSGLAATSSNVIATSCSGKTIDGVVLSAGTSIGRVSAVQIAATNLTGQSPLTIGLSSPVLSSQVDQVTFEVRD